MSINKAKFRIYPCNLFQFKMEFNISLEDCGTKEPRNGKLFCMRRQMDLYVSSCSFHRNLTPIFFKPLNIHIHLHIHIRIFQH